MKYRFIPAFIMLLAGLITCILGLVQKWPVETNLIALAIVLVVFYVVGQIAGQVIGRVQSERKAMEELEKKKEMSLALLLEVNAIMAVCFYIR